MGIYAMSGSVKCMPISVKRRITAVTTRNRKITNLYRAACQAACVSPTAWLPPSDAQDLCQQHTPASQKSTKALASVVCEKAADKFAIFVNNIQSPS